MLGKVWWSWVKAKVLYCFILEVCRCFTTGDTTQNTHQSCLSMIVFVRNHVLRWECLFQTVWPTTLTKSRNGQKMADIRLLIQALIIMEESFCRRERLKCFNSALQEFSLLEWAYLSLHQLSPRDVAERKGHKKIAEYLQRAGMLDVRML